MTIRWRWVIFVVVLLGAWQHWSSRPLKPPPGSIAPREPLQTEVGREQVYQQNGYRLEALANFDIEARVLSRSSYHLGREAELSPLDLALGWGAMSDSGVLSQLDISQSGRAYFYRWQNPPPLPPRQIAEQSANMHLIPINSTIADKMDEVRVGQVVRIVGQLVEAKAPDGWHWRSSLTREDTGAGACEVIRVTSFEIRPGH